MEQYGDLNADKHSPASSARIANVRFTKQDKESRREWRTILQKKQKKRKQ